MPINAFPGYEYIPGPENKGKGRNMYRGIDLGFGGYVYSEPGMYTNVALIDVSSLHPSSIIALNKLGKYTQKFKDLRDARVFIKHHDYEAAGKLFDGKLSKYLTNDEEADALSKALKLPINSFFGISFASFSNPARDSRDVNDIIALRGALFMKTLQDEVQEMGYKIVHIKTDSLKIPNADQKIIDYCMKRAKEYGYEFEYEATYSKMCLVDKANYIARYDDKGIRNKGGKHANEWTPTGDKFAHPYVFKSLFTHEEIIFDDMCEVFNVKEGSIYIDFNEGFADGEHNYQFIGNVGQFTPIISGQNGGGLFCIKDGKAYAVQGTKGYRWMESEAVKLLGLEDKIDRDYYRKLVDEAVAAISEFGDIEWFVSDSMDSFEQHMNAPITDNPFGTTIYRSDYISKDRTKSLSTINAEGSWGEWQSEHLI